MVETLPCLDSRGGKPFVFTLPAVSRKVISPTRETLLSLPFLPYQGKGTSPREKLLLSLPFLSRHGKGIFPSFISYFCMQSTNYVRIVWLSHFVMNDQCVFKYSSLFAKKKKL